LHGLSNYIFDFAPHLVYISVGALVYTLYRYMVLIYNIIHTIVNYWFDKYQFTSKVFTSVRYVKAGRYIQLLVALLTFILFQMVFRTYIHHTCKYICIYFITIKVRHSLHHIISPTACDVNTSWLTGLTIIILHNIKIILRCTYRVIHVVYNAVSW